MKINLGILTNTQTTQGQIYIGHGLQNLCKPRFVYLFAFLYDNHTFINSLKKMQASQNKYVKLTTLHSEKHNYVTLHPIT